MTQDRVRCHQAIPTSLVYINDLTILKGMSQCFNLGSTTFYHQWASAQLVPQTRQLSVRNKVAWNNRGKSNPVGVILTPCAQDDPSIPVVGTFYIHVQAINASRPLINVSSVDPNSSERGVCDFDLSEMTAANSLTLSVFRDWYSNGRRITRH